MSDRPEVNTALVYGKVAELLPTEGRDFLIDAAYDPERRAQLSITPLTPLGRAWVPFLAESLRTEMAQIGVAGISDGKPAVQTESETIRTVRARIEAEAAEKRKSRIAEAEKDLADRRAEMKAVRERQPPASVEEVRKSAVAANNASLNLYNLQRTSSRVDGIRSEVDAAAETAAREDEKKGKPWAVDLDAPLTSLFDRQDISRKLREKEYLLEQIATHAVAIDDLKNQAVTVAKQYILQKGQ